ncbi:MAG: sulfatase [Phycisphaeraceae bacterium]|nr:sulfatase [Phycisphaeraceae bacterium]
MKAIVVMFDTLNRHFLPPYGCSESIAPNFARLARRTVTFDRSYVCSMPCMPARRDMHTARPNFLHRSWGAIEPFDDSVPEMLHEAGVHTHLTTDHYHYFEDGGMNYHCRYTTWDASRGQEGDPWIGQVADPDIPPVVHARKIGRKWRQDFINRAATPTDAEHSQTRTFRNGLEYIDRNHDQDNWCLTIETFDPHEPFFSHRMWKDRFAEHYDKYKGKHFDWPPYDRVTEMLEESEHLRFEYLSLLAKCDASLGMVMDKMDRYDLWKDTMLIVCTDHGFLLGEHEMYAKVWMPFYEEVSHTPFFIWDPRCGKAGERRNALIQPAIDIPVTLLNYFGIAPTSDMRGHDLAMCVRSDQAVREAAIFGVFGGHINVTDGRYVYMRAPVNNDNQPLYEYTLLPCAMANRVTEKELAGDRIELCEPFNFTKNCHLLKVRANFNGSMSSRQAKFATQLFDLQNDPQQLKPIQDAAVEQRLIQQMVRLMRDCDAPAEQYQRLGLLTT